MKITKISLSIPTLGTRPELLLATLKSLSEFTDLKHIEVCTPDRPSVVGFIESTDLPEISVYQDDADQANAILNSWRRNPSNWYAWINDDDIANPIMCNDVENALSGNFKDPTVIYGDFGILKQDIYSKIPTPSRITYNILRYGGNYVPGLMTFINQPALEILLRHRETNQLFRDSFDYQWWLELSKENARFKHLNGPIGFWRDHTHARTVMENHVGREETQILIQSHQNKKFSPNQLRVLRLYYKSISKFMSLSL